MELQNTVKEALNALYHHPDDLVRNQADRWLQDFQRTIDAWQVADNLLHDANSNMETLIFCSQTLRSKVQRDIEELPPDAIRPLRDSLITLLRKFHRGPLKVRTQISIAVAAMAVHVPAEDWGDNGIVNWLKDEMNAYPEFVPGFLELLTVLPEEVSNYKIAARPDRRRLFEKELTSQIQAALDILTACLNINELKEQVLDAFASWLRLKHSVPGSMLASHPLVLSALASLKSEFVLEAAVNVISELIHYSAAVSSTGVFVHLPLIQTIVPEVMSLKGQLRDSFKDEEDVKAIARLIADIGDSYVDLIASGSDESMMIMHALLEVASHPEYDIASMTFNFWHSLQVNLTTRDSYHSSADETSIEAERKRRLQIFGPPYESLVSLVIFRVQYPQDYEDLSQEDMKDFRLTRYAVAEVLSDAAMVLGGQPTLKILYLKLVESVARCGNGQQDEWRPAEAALYCIWAIANYVSVVEAEVMPQIMDLLPKLPQQAQLLQTVCLTVGAYSKWLDAALHGHYILPPVIEILMNGMGISEDSAAVAALAFKHICDDCRKKVCGSLDALFHIYHKAVYGDGYFKVAAEDSLHLVEALSMVITELPPEQAKKPLELLCIPAVNPLQDIITRPHNMLSKMVAREFTVHIDRLAYIFRYVNHPEAVADAVQRLWPIIKAIFDIRAWDMRTMESLCRACKYAVRTSGRFMGVTIERMLEEIQSQYQQHHQPCFLYFSSEVIKIFGSDPACANYLRNLIEALFNHTTCILTNVQEFTIRPDIADDCFLLASRCIRYCPQLFLPSAVFPQLVDCSMIGITIQHREASNSILNFLSDIFDLEKSSLGKQYLAYRDAAVLPRGANIARLLIAAFTGALPYSRLETVAYALLALTRAFGCKAVEWARQSISLIPLTALTEVERSRFLQALFDTATVADVTALIPPLEELSDVCRRNRTVQEIVQGALRPLELNVLNVS